jgi:serine protease SohB
MKRMIRFIPFLKSPPFVAVIRLSGMISSGPRGLNDAALAPVIDRAFRRGKPSAVALVINSPGGAPVQTALIAARIRRLSQEKGVPVHAFVEDVAASGGYWLATAADQIWIDESSVVGSIGVISASFGFHELLARQGIERRVHTAGGSKSFLDPFKPEKPEDVARLKALQEPIHQSFIAQVKARRGARLAEGDLFTGEVWVGWQAVQQGLADGIGHLVPKMKELFGDKVRFAVFGPRRSLFQRFGVRLIDDAISSIEERALWARYGL